MDNLTHSLLAGAIARTPLGRRSPLSGVALVVAANVPDLDVLVRFAGGLPYYLVYHRGVTHSVAGMLFIALALGLLFGALERLRARRRGEPPPRAGPGPAVLVGLASHLGLDWLNVYGVRPWLPLSGTWHHGDLAFIVDPWQWLLFGAAAALPGRRTRRGDVLWALLALVASAFLLASDRAPLAAKVGFPLGACLVAAVRARGIGSRAPRATGVACVALVAAYFGVVHAGRTRAERIAAHEVAQVAPEAALVARAPWPADPLRWTILFEEPDRWHAVDVSPGAPPRARAVDKNLDGDVLRAIADTDEAWAWREFARTPFVRVEATEGGALVRLLDLRYVDADGGSWCELVVRVTEPERARELLREAGR